MIILPPCVVAYGSYCRLRMYENDTEIIDSGSVKDQGNEMQGGRLGIDSNQSFTFLHLDEPCN